MTPKAPTALVYSCSGCSDVAQLANSVAIKLDHAGIAEMSCIAGIGGNVPGITRKALSGRPIIAIDGCQMHCAAHCLKQIDVEPNEHIKLYEQGFTKTRGRSYDDAVVDGVVSNLIPVVDALTSAPSAESVESAEPPQKLAAQG